MPGKPLDILRLAHSSALSELELLEKSAQSLKKNGNSPAILEPLNKTFHFFDGELKVHFRHEEEVLFPYLARIIGREGPIAAMLDEHQTLWRTLELFQEKVDDWQAAPKESASKQAEAVRLIANHIVAFLRSHIQKEDSVLFPLAEESLDPITMKEVIARIQDVETPS